MQTDCMKYEKAYRIPALEYPRSIRYAYRHLCGMLNKSNILHAIGHSLVSWCKFPRERPPTLTLTAKRFCKSRRAWIFV